MRPRFAPAIRPLVLLALLGAVGCAPGGSTSGSGGASGTGTGGAGTGSGSGGASVPGSGGATTSSGGAPGSGGATTSSGGAPGSGGATTSTGGATGAGSGGRVGTGGAATTTGGTSGGSGGMTGTATGGRGGGTTATGGAGTGSGGSAGGGGPSSSGLPTPPGAGGVARPSGTPGALTILPWAGFKAAVSYTFDDTNSSQIQNYAALNGMGVPLTFYLITNKTTEFNNAVWPQALKDGHELANHTKSHQMTGTAADVDAGATDIKNKFGVDVWTMAAPYGDTSYVSLASTRYLINRGVNNGQIGYMNDNTDPFNIFCFIPAQGAAATAFNAEIDALRTAGKWKTVLVHGFTGGSDGAYQPVAIGEFTSSVAHTKSLGDVWIDTVVAVGSYWRAHKMLAAVTPTMSGTSRTWTWTLPAHFPPKKYLRVKVDGGTMTQGGTAVPWNDHGYYEIALDAGSVTLAP